MSTPAGDMPIIPPDDGGIGGQHGSNDPPLPFRLFVMAFCTFFDKYIEFKKINLTETELEWHKSLYSVLKNSSLINEIVLNLEITFNMNNTNGLGKMLKNVLRLELQAVTEHMNSTVNEHDQKLEKYESGLDKGLIVVDSVKDNLEGSPLGKLALTTWKECVEIFRRKS